MRRIVRHRPSPAMVIACIALAVALGGTSYAAVSLPRNSVGTAQLKRNAVNSAKVRNFSLLRVDFRRGQLPAGPRGPQGPAGAQGAQGGQGAQGIQGPAGPGARWATVNPNGTVARQSGGISVTKPQVGAYLLNFNEDVSARLILASPSLNNDGTFRGTVLASSCVDYAAFCTGVGVPSLQNTVVVFTTTVANNVQADHAFQLGAILPAGSGASPMGIPSGPLGELGSN
jgi:hypothetical protein